MTIIAERVEYLDENGKLITESLRDYSKRALKNRFASLDDFLRRWNAADRKQAIIDELEEEGLSLEPLAEEVGKDLDPFDLICHVAFDQPAAHPPRARRQRAQAGRLHQVRPPGPRRARSPAAEVPGPRRRRPRRSADSSDSAARAHGHPVELIDQFGTRADFDRLSTNSKLLCIEVA